MAEKNEVELKKIEPATKQVQDLIGKDAKPIEFVSKKGFTFKILPCSLYDLPDLHELIADWQKSNVGSETENKFFTREQIVKMAKIVKFGIKDYHPEWKEEDISKSIATSDFPAILNIIMDLNDFFVNMRGITVKTELANKSAGK